MGIWTSAEHRGEQVDAYYLSFLHRASDATGRAYWVSQFVTGGLNEVGVTLAFVTSTEYVTDHSGSYVAALYADILGRAADSAGLTFYQNLLANGATMNQIADSIIFSTESELLAVDSYYLAFLQRTADSAGQTFWQQSIQGGQSSYGSTAYSFLASLEYFSNAGASLG